jgi:hypothetical protein
MPSCCPARYREDFLAGPAASYVMGAVLVLPRSTCVAAVPWPHAVAPPGIAAVDVLQMSGARPGVRPGSATRCRCGAQRHADVRHPGSLIFSALSAPGRSFRAIAIG